MPSRAVPRKVRDFILYYYAKLVIAPSAGEAKNYRFIMDRYRRLKAGELRISDYDREIERARAQRGLCAFCGARAPTVPAAIVPPSLGGPVGVHNLVHACRSCARSKDDKDLVRWWCDDLGRDKDDLPRVPIGLFLKLAYERHVVSFTLERPCHDIREIWPATGGHSRTLRAM
jgi:hypothetical protein